ncbi:hypothetical protein [Sulfurospirillum sp. SCADC]|uniref:hypothetical protein n=1 Tax=Sulfurospirillum sp. SCADC TaxID=1537915 RepID=UPI000A6D2999|nr:hypothetical protein [Sulfurospirillum sp. SCADC]
MGEIILYKASAVSILETTATDGKTCEKFKSEHDKVYVSDFDKLVAKVENKS